MEQYQLKKPASVKSRKRVGRGMSSGHGKTSGRGQKGAGSRSGHTLRLGFEGGQMPLQRRIPKRGFNNIFKVEYQIVNLQQLNKLENVDTIDADAMKKFGCIRDDRKLIKVLGRGELSKGVTVFADVFSKSAKEKIEKAGGKAEIRALAIEKKAQDANE